MRYTCPECSKIIWHWCEDCGLCDECCTCPPLTDDDANKPIRWLWPQVPR